MAPARLEQSLKDGVADLTAIATGTPPTFLRPPFWGHNERTFLAHQAHGLHVIITDLNDNNGKIYGFNASPTRRSHMRRELDDVRKKIARREMPVFDGAILVLVTFHDVNRYTARHMREYPQILLDSAADL